MVVVTWIFGNEILYIRNFLKFISGGFSAKVLLFKVVLNGVVYNGNSPKTNAMIKKMDILLFLI